MAAVEQNPAGQRIARDRSARLADQAATAALYVTHPERRRSLLQPPAEPDPNLNATGTRSEYSHASAMAALAHARKREAGARQAASTFQAADRRKAEAPSCEGYPYQAAMCATKEQKISGTQGNRRRAESAPSEAARAGATARLEGPGDPLEGLDKYMNASRIRNAHLNPKLFTATPPVALELEEHRKKSILEAASISMAKDMYGVTESKEGRSAGLQRLPTGARHQRSVSKPEAGTLQQALNLQDVAQKRAAERLASLDDATADYRNYYGVEPQGPRSSFALRKRRGSNETEQFDIERSKEIRTQMTALRFKLDAVDEKREKDRSSLLKLAKKNVDAAIEEMDKRLYAETGQPVTMQKYLDEKAMERAQKDIQDIDTQHLLAGKVNIGGQRYVDMADIEQLARSRLQPTFDEIEELAQTQQAREVEARLDEEQRQHILTLEREREADIEMEERQNRELLKQEHKSREEKVWPWRRKTRQTHGIAPTTERPSEPLVNGDTAAPPEPQRRTTGAAQTETVSRRESKFKSWFSDRLGHRSSASPPKETNETQEEGRRASEPAQRHDSGTESAGDGQEMEAGRAEVAGGEAHQSDETGVENDHIAKSGAGGSHTREGNSRAAPLRSNPVIPVDLNQPAQTRPSDESGDRLDGMTPSEYLATAQDSQDIVERSDSIKQQRRQQQGSSVHELPTPLNERESLRESAGEHSLPAPPSIGDVGHKRTSSTARESRFSEDL
ncbi:hypothetical protein BDW59DRAFT_142855 [Aspergillus cavernicola]|uniref:Eisosome protein 1 n=1 Tax=Aspergillus cavernicola TaxID=176166 RepID=A0ABR4ILP8_9EURO